MAIAFVRQQIGSVKAGTPCTVTLAQSPEAGAALVAVVTIQGTTISVSSISGGGVTWVLGRRRVGTTVSSEVWYGINASGSGTAAITITPSASATMAANVSQFSGVAVASAYDIFAEASATGTAPTTGSATTTNANDVVVGGAGWSGTAATTAGPTNTWTALTSHLTTGGNATTNVTGRCAYKILTATGAQSTAWTLASTAYAGVWVALKADTGARTATAALTSPAKSRTAAGVSVGPTFTGNAALTARAKSIAATGVFLPVRTATAALTSPGKSSTSAGVVPFNATAALVARAKSIASAGINPFNASSALTARTKSVTSTGTRWVPSASAPRAVVFNGTTQYAKRALPTSAPWNNLGAFKIAGRIRNYSMLAGDGDQSFTIYSDSDFSVQIKFSGGSDTQPNMAAVIGRDIIAGGDGAIFKTVSTHEQVIWKFQFDPTNTRYTFELFHPNGSLLGTSGTLSSTLDNTNFNFGDGTGELSLGAWGNGTNLLANTMDWVFIQQGVDALGVFPGKEPATGTYMALYKFDADTGVDSSGNSLDLTLVGTPTYADSPLYSNVTVTAGSSVTVTGGNSLEKTGGANGDNLPADRVVVNQALSAVGDEITFTVPQSNKNIYIGYDASSSQSVAQADFDLGVDFGTAADVYWRSPGNARGNGSYSAGDVLTLRLVDVSGTTRLRLLRGEATLYTFTLDTAPVPGYVHINFGDLNAKVSNIIVKDPSGGGASGGSAVAELVARAKSITAAGVHTSGSLHTGNAALTSRTKSITASGSNPFNATSALVARAKSIASTATRTVPNYTGNAALTAPQKSMTATGVRGLPVYTADVVLMGRQKSSTASGVSTLPQYAGSAALTSPQKSITTAGVRTVPVYTGDAALTNRTKSVASTGVSAVPNYIGNAALTSRPKTIASIATNPVNATAALVARAKSITSTGVHVVPVYTGNAALTNPARTSSSSGTVAVPVYTGNVALTASQKSVTSTGVNPFRADAALTSRTKSIVASGTVSTVQYAANAALTSRAKSIIASGVVTEAVFTANAVLTNRQKSASGSGVSAVPVYTGNSALTTLAKSVSSTGSVPFDASASLVARAKTVAATSTNPFRASSAVVSLAKSIGASGVSVVPVYTANSNLTALNKSISSISSNPFILSASLSSPPKSVTSTGVVPYYIVADVISLAKTIAATATFSTVGYVANAALTSPSKYVTSVGDEGSPPTYIPQPYVLSEFGRINVKTASLTQVLKKIAVLTNVTADAVAIITVASVRPIAVLSVVPSKVATITAQAKPEAETIIHAYYHTPD